MRIVVAVAVAIEQSCEQSLPEEIARILEEDPLCCETI